MVSGFAIGQFIDLTGEDSRMVGFSWYSCSEQSLVYSVGFNLIRAPFPQTPDNESETASIRDLMTPFRNKIC